ncbi:hypothetical protein E2C01_096698 [Portunus trituberculatus]|uniref:Uncharacterized protein n=1 Tax=Portunus trituberculatus TaxID=210409 RepID=A0A5B7K2F7_PORTR|nr:hypothetical protein [Portunus trituberculatus]
MLSYIRAERRGGSGGGREIKSAVSEALKGALGRHFNTSTDVIRSDGRGTAASGASGPHPRCPSTPLAAAHRHASVTSSIPPHQLLYLTVFNLFAARLHLYFLSFFTLTSTA